MTLMLTHVAEFSRGAATTCFNYLVLWRRHYMTNTGQNTFQLINHSYVY